ncbi:hypothetical protein DR999_PMT06114 [Platysternon megacephalum]|uniref:Uncharacterized protein n=1 Tax=Platysternon megacephalum TaxID=55544 RepID=A0A4D9EJ34_9SAUR|nr:hypothetical protein DR999_PMT06114 [Platysternon megacephalum]
MANSFSPHPDFPRGPRPAPVPPSHPPPPGRVNGKILPSGALCQRLTSRLDRGQEIRLVSKRLRTAQLVFLPSRASCWWGVSLRTLEEHLSWQDFKKPLGFIHIRVGFFYTPR